MTIQAYGLSLYRYAVKRTGKCRKKLCHVLSYLYLSFCYALGDRFWQNLSLSLKKLKGKGIALVVIKGSGKKKIECLNISNRGKM